MNTYTPDPLVEDGIAAFDVISYLASLGLAQTGARDEVVLDCPRCGGHGKLWVNTRKKQFICYKCADQGTRGGIPRLITVLEGIPMADALARLRTAPAIPVVTAPPPPLVIDPAVALPATFRRLTDPRDPWQTPYWRYLAHRRVDPDDILGHGMGYVRLGDLAGRLIVPIVTAGVLESYVARDITGTLTPKVQTPRGNHQSRTLFNLDRVTPAAPVVLTEGVFDALRAPECCVATFGKRLTLAQRLLLGDRGIRDLIVAWDADAAREAAYTAYAIAPLFRSVRVAELPSGQDPSALDAATFRACLARARPADLAGCARGASLSIQERVR